MRKKNPPPTLTTTMTSRTNLSKIENFSQNKKNHIIGDIESSRTINLSSLQTFHVDHFLIFHLKARKAKNSFQFVLTLSLIQISRVFFLPNVPAKANILTSEDQEAVVNIQRLGHFFSQPSGRQILNFNIHLMNLTEPEEGEKWILNGKFKPPRIPPNYVNVYTLTPFQEMFLTKHEIFPFFFYFKFKL